MSNTGGSREDSDRKEGGMHEPPISRLWACVFSVTILALLWTQKMKKTRRWMLAFAFFVMVWCTVDTLLYYEYYEAEGMPFDMMVLFETYGGGTEHMATLVDRLLLDAVGTDILPDTAYSDNMIYSMASSILFVHDWIAIPGSFALVVYLMYRWTTLYNLENFGYRSKGEWKKAGRPQGDGIGHRIREGTHDGARYAASMMRDVGSKSADRIGAASSRIMDVGGKSADKIGAAAASRIRHGSDTQDDEVVRRIQKWHGLAKKGAISAAEFEAKKREILGAGGGRDDA